MDKDEIRKLANSGDAEAMYQLGLMYESGDGMMQNTSIALKRFREAADKGHEKAKGKLEQLSHKYKIASYTPKTTDKKKPDSEEESTAPVAPLRHEPDSCQKDIASADQPENDKPVRPTNGRKYYFCDNRFQLGKKQNMKTLLSMRIDAECIAFLGEDKETLFAFLNSDIGAPHVFEHAIQLKWEHIDRIEVHKGRAPSTPDAWLFRHTPKWIHPALHLINIDFSPEGISKFIWHTGSWLFQGWWHLEIITHEGSSVRINGFDFDDNIVNSGDLATSVRLKMYLEHFEYLAQQNETITPEESRQLWESKKENIKEPAEKVLAEWFMAPQYLIGLSIILLVVGNKYWAITSDLGLVPLISTMVTVLVLFGTGIHIAKHMHISKKYFWYWLIEFVIIIFAVLILAGFFDNNPPA